MLKSLLVIAVGASLGAWLRWLLGMKLNALFPTIPPGTVIANMSSVVSRCLDLMKLPTSIRQVLDQHPGLITANYAKKFVDLAEQDVHIVERQVLSMVEKGTKQEQALRQIAVKIAACSNQGRPAFVPRPVAGIGTIKLSGQKLELKCEKGIDPNLLLQEFENFLNKFDRSKLAAKEAE